MSIPRSIGWALFNKRVPNPVPRRAHIYQTKAQALAANYVDGSWHYDQHQMSPTEIRAARQAKVLARYDIKEVFVND